MLRYQVRPDPGGQFLVFPAIVGIVPWEETYATRREADDAAAKRNAARQGAAEKSRMISANWEATRPLTGAWVAEVISC